LNYPWSDKSSSFLHALFTCLSAVRCSCTLHERANTNLLNAARPIKSYQRS